MERALASNPRSRASFCREPRRANRAGQPRPPLKPLSSSRCAGSGEYNVFEAAEYFALSQVIELGGKREARGASAQSARELLTVERQVAQLDVLAEVTRRFIAVAAAQEQVALTQEGVSLARSTVDDVGLRVRAAKSPEGELLRSRAALSRAGLEEHRTVAQLGTPRHSSRRLW